MCIRDSNSRFYQQATETKLLAQNASFEDRWIAEFWSDDIFELTFEPVSYTHLRAHETVLDLVCRLLLEKKTK